ncbi:MAG: glycosyltransferase [Flavobacteriales bacterium]|nr:glycosyltransferase [Flavobacteriales bacterium]
MKLCWLLINYFKEEELVSFVREFLLDQTEGDIEVRIADNGSYKPEVLDGLLSDKRVRIDGNGTNLGYFGGANLAFQGYQLEHGSFPDLIVISNFDVEFDKKNFISKMQEEVLKSPFQILAPRIRNRNSLSEMNPYYSERISISKLNRLISITAFYPLYAIYQLLHLVKKNVSSSGFEGKSDGPFYAIHGSFIILKREYFESGAHLTFGSFLYGEELFLAEMAALHRLKTGVCKSIEVIHKEHSTTGVFKSAKHMRFLHDSLVYIRQNFFKG